MRHSLALSVAVTALGSAFMPAVGGAQVPGAGPDIPAYPAAERFDPEGFEIVTSIRETLLGHTDGLPLLTTTTDVSIADALPEDVATFYRARLGGIDSGFEMWNAVDPRTLSPGSSTPVHRQSYPLGGSTLYVYHWFNKEGNGDIRLTELSITDAPILDPRLQGRKGPVTIITVTRKTFSTSAPSSAPDESTLGAPIYPGAIYDSNESRSTLGALFSHVFYTGDPLERVVAFYEGACGRKALQGEPVAGGTNWYFRPCSTGLPDDYILIWDERGASGSRRTIINFNLFRGGSGSGPPP